MESRTRFLLVDYAFSRATEQFVLEGKKIRHRKIQGKKEMNEVLRWIFLLYFITHIPITLCVDLQVIFGHLYPKALTDVNDWYLATYHDMIIARKPLWLQSFIWAECLFQMPFFFVATYGLWKRKNWIRIPSIIYGSHVATTVWAILAEILLGNDNTVQEKATLFGFYAPYFVVPALLVIVMAWSPEPFAKTEKTLKRG